MGDVRVSLLGKKWPEKFRGLGTAKVGLSESRWEASPSNLGGGGRERHSLAVENQRPISLAVQLLPRPFRGKRMPALAGGDSRIRIKARRSWREKTLKCGCSGGLPDLPNTAGHPRKPGEAGMVDRIRISLKVASKVVRAKIENLSRKAMLPMPLENRRGPSIIS